MDWYADCSYQSDRKRRFHSTARTRLRHLAQELGFATGSFDVRSNHGGIAVSGEITLHHDDIYVQVCQPATLADTAILIRTCAGRRDYAGGRNHFEPLARLDDIPGLATRVRTVMAEKTGAIRAA